MWNFSTKEKLNRIEPGDFRWENEGKNCWWRLFFYYVAVAFVESFYGFKSHFLLCAIQWVDVKCPLNFKKPLSRTPKYAMWVSSTKAKSIVGLFFHTQTFAYAAAAAQPCTSSDDSLNFINKELYYKHHE